MINFTCPRRYETGANAYNINRLDNGTNKDVWDSENTCSYCGSLNPDDLMERLEAGNISLTPTDKNYKIYVEGIPDPNAGKPTIYSTSNFPQTGEGWVQVTEENKYSLPLKDDRDFLKWIKVEPTRPFMYYKFYFQHLSSEQQQQFCILLNNNKLKLNVPGYFYKLPFFLRKM